MGYHPRIEVPNVANLITIRTRNSELWFANNPKAENAILGYLAKYSTKREVDLYAAALEGSHIHLACGFPKDNRAPFMRDLGSQTAKTVARHTPHYPGGRLFSRRYSQEFLPEAPDTEERFWYVVMQPIQDGLVERLSDYPLYNCFNDAINGRSRTFKVVNWTAYNEFKRRNKHKPAYLADFVETVTLTYKRLPGYESMTQTEYKNMMLRKYEQRRLKLVQARLKEGGGFLGKDALLRVRPGQPAKNPKTSHRRSHRPRVLCVCPIRRQKWLSWYFDIYFRYKLASKRYRQGELSVEFPPGTYRPPAFTCLAVPPD